MPGTPAPIPRAASRALTLAEAQALALANHPEVRANDLKIRAAEQDVRIARSNYLPQASGNAVRVLADDGTRILAGGGINNPTILDRGAYGVSISQLITDFGRTGDLVDASGLQVEARRSRAELARGGVVLSVTRAYYQLLRARELVKVAQSTRQARRAFLEQVASLREARLKSDLDLSLASQGVQEAGLLALRAEAALGDAQSGLSEALGYADERRFEPEPVPPPGPPPHDVRPLLERALRLNPEIAALRAEVGAERKRADAEEKAEYPTVSALAHAGDAPLYNGAASVNRTYAAAGVNVSIPLYAGGRLTAQRKKAGYQAEASGQELESRVHALSRDIRGAWSGSRTAYENIGVSRKLLENANETLGLIRARYELGKSSIVELSQAQLNATGAEIAAANAEYDYAIQRAWLEYLVGTPL